MKIFISAIRNEQHVNTSPIISTANQEMEMRNGNENFANNKSVHNEMSTINSTDETASSLSMEKNGTKMQTSLLTLNNMTMTRDMNKRE